MRILILCALGLLLTTQPWAGGVAHQIADLNPQASLWDPAPVQPSPFQFAEVNGVAIFFANSKNAGTEPWRSDGTDDGTYLLKDINPGPDWSNEYGSSFYTFGDLVCFNATDGHYDNDSYGWEYWCTDGTREGTRLAADTQNDDGHPNALGHVNDTLFLYDWDFGLWKTSGTVTSSEKLRAFWHVSPPAVSYDSAIFFGAMGSPQVGEELWKSDGTVEGTVLVADIRPGSGSSLPTPIGTASGTIILRADDGVHGRELWRSDGTAPGTSMIRDINPGPTSTLVHEHLSLGGDLYLVLRDPEHGSELWRTDGTDVGTYLVADICPGTCDGVEGELQRWNDLLIFAANDPAHGTELWRSDGTTAGTSLIKDLTPGPDSSRPERFRSFQDALHFTAQGGALWRTDGSTAGTSFLDWIPKNDGDDMIAAGEALIFGGPGFDDWEDYFGYELLGYDGQTTRMIKNIGEDLGHSDPREFVTLGDQVVLAVRQPDFQLFVSDGTEPGTYPISVPMPAWTPHSLRRSGDKIYFVGGDSIAGSELWVTDGTAAGTRRVADVRPGPASSSPTRLTPVGSGVFFLATGPGGRELWFSDGTESGTVFLADAVFAEGPDTLSVLDGDVFFIGRDTATGSELWRSDGTGPGTQLVADIVPGTGSSLDHRTYTGVAGGVLYFSANDGTNGIELWRTDGTEAGTILVRDIRSGAGPSGPREMTEFNGRLYFSADDYWNGRELWTSDGTEAGTVLVKDVRPGSYGSNPSAFTLLNGALIFDASDGTHGRELWRTDGSEAGTALLSDVCEGTSGSAPRQVTPIGSRAWFLATDCMTGTELWSTDGTTAGTKLMQDVAPGPFSGATSVKRYGELAVSRGLVFFTGTDGVQGDEPWAFPIASPGAVPDGAGTPGAALQLAKAGDQLSLSWGSASCEAGTTDYEIYTGPLGAYSDPIPERCSTGGGTTALVEPGAGDSFYLVVPRNVVQEGSYGVTGAGVERAASTVACLPQVLDSNCE